MKHTFWCVDFKHQEIISNSSDQLESPLSSPGNTTTADNFVEELNHITSKRSIKDLEFELSSKQNML